MVTVGKNKRWPIVVPVEYLADNTIIYKNAYTKEELFAALWRAERKIKRQMVKDTIHIDIESAIREVLGEYFDSLGPGYKNKSLHL